MAEDKKANTKAGAKVVTKKAKRRQAVPVGHFYIRSSENNTLVTVCDPNGNVLFQRSSGQAGFKGTKKSTPYAATVVISTCANEALLYSMVNVHVFLRDVGQSVENAIRALNSNKLNVLSIRDITPHPHGGCTVPRQRKV